MAKKNEATEKRPVSRTYTVNCLLLLTIGKTYPLEQARSNLCHVGSVCSSHLGGTTHLVDKRGTLEQA